MYTLPCLLHSPLQYLCGRRPTIILFAHPNCLLSAGVVRKEADEGKSASLTLRISLHSRRLWIGKLQDLSFCPLSPPQQEHSTTKPHSSLVLPSSTAPRSTIPPFRPFQHLASPAFAKLRIISKQCQPPAQSSTTRNWGCA